MKYKFINEVIDGKKTHCHTLGGAPLLGTSSVVGVLAKPLTWWASGLAVAELGWKNPKFTSEQERLDSASLMREKIWSMGEVEYLKLLDKAYKAHSVKLDKSADSGTDMHEELEKYVKGCIERGGEPEKTDSEVPAVRIFSEWAIKNVEMFVASEGNCYSERLWVGGITDCYAILKGKKLAIIDFKSSKEAYVSQFIQVAGYDIQISENGLFDSDGNCIHEDDPKADCYIIFPFGAEKVEPAIRYDTEDLRKGFESAVVLYKLMNQ